MTERISEEEDCSRHEEGQQLTEVNAHLLALILLMQHSILPSQANHVTFTRTRSHKPTLARACAHIRFQRSIHLVESFDHEIVSQFWTRAPMYMYVLPLRSPSTSLRISFSFLQTMMFAHGVTISSRSQAVHAYFCASLNCIARFSPHPHESLLAPTTASEFDRQQLAETKANEQR